MSAFNPVDCPVRLISARIAIATLTLLCGGCYEPDKQELAQNLAQEQQKQQMQKEIRQTKAFVEQGSETDAKAYYTETFDALGIKSNVGNNEPALEAMLVFLGYTDLTPKSLENEPSAELMKRYGEDLRASAFFAPKITDVSQDSSKINVGWRKIIRLRARGADAVKAGISAGYLLFNKFQGSDREDDPFDGEDKHESLTTQLILVRGTKSPNAEPKNRPLHFFVFGPVSAGAKLKLALQASFDAAAPEVEKELAKKGPIKDYFVPVACAQCHGGVELNHEGVNVPIFARQKLNMLDTDHWFDRIQPGDDFAFLQDSKFSVLFDGDKDPSSPKFKAAFDVLRRLNEEIKAQNELVEDAAKPSFQFRAISLWLKLHNGDSSHKDIFARALDPVSGAGAKWNRDSEIDMHLLPKMNRYCYRCHSSITYNVFDRSEVVCRKPKILRYLQLPADDPMHMPQDRVLDKVTLNQFLELFTKLPDSKCN